MSGTKEGARKTAKINKRLYGEDFYARIGAKGGRNSDTGGFASDKVGLDGLTGKQRASIAGKRGAEIKKAKKKSKYEHHRSKIRGVDYLVEKIEGVFK